MLAQQLLLQHVGGEFSDSACRPWTRSHSQTVSTLPAFFFFFSFFLKNALASDAGVPASGKSNEVTWIPLRWFSASVRCSSRRHCHNTAKMFLCNFLVGFMWEAMMHGKRNLSKLADRPVTRCFCGLSLRVVPGSPETGSHLHQWLPPVSHWAHESRVCVWVCVTSVKKDAGKNSNYKEILPLLCKKQTWKILLVLIHGERPYAARSTRSCWNAVDKNAFMLMSL